MYCGRCGNKNPDSHSFCSACGFSLCTDAECDSALTSAVTAPELGERTGVEPTITPTVSPTSGKMPPKSAFWRRVNVLLAGGFLALVLTLIYTVNLNRNDSDWAGAAGATFGTCLIPLIGVGLYYRKKSASAARIMLVNALWIFVAFGVANNARRSTLTKADIPKLAQEAVGKSAIDDSGSPEKNLIRDFFRSVKESNDAYMKQVEKLEADYSGDLLSAASFKSTEVIQQRINYLEKAIALENEQERTVASLKRGFADRVYALNWTQSQKQAFLTGFDKTFSRNMEQRNRCLAKEMKYLNGAVELYRFMLANRTRFQVEKDQVLFSTQSLVQTFNSKVDAVNISRKDYEAELKQFEEAQKKQMAEVGLTPADMGLTK